LAKSSDASEIPIPEIPERLRNILVSFYFILIISLTSTSIEPRFEHLDGFQWSVGAIDDMRCSGSQSGLSRVKGVRFLYRLHVGKKSVRIRFSPGPRFFEFTPFLHVGIGKGKKPREKQWKCKKGRKKGAKNGGKKATVNNTNDMKSTQAAQDSLQLVADSLIDYFELSPWFNGL
jgi:hypothetical protein